MAKRKPKMPPMKGKRMAKAAFASEGNNTKPPKVGKAAAKAPKPPKPGTYRQRMDAADL